MEPIYTRRRQVVHGQDMAKKLKRMASLFFIVDSLILIKITYNLIFEVFDETPWKFIIWIIILAVAGLISIVLIIKLWLVERQKTKEIKRIDAEAKEQHLKRKKKSRFNRLTNYSGKFSRFFIG